MPEHIPYDSTLWSLVCSRLDVGGDVSTSTHEGVTEFVYPGLSHGC